MIQTLKLSLLRISYKFLYKKYKHFTMIPPKAYIENIEIIRQYKHVTGDVVECGVWRGGMIAGIADIFGDSREYHLFDSFEGLPKAKEIDGQSAIQWQNDTKGKWYLDNCKAEIDFAVTAMKMTKCSKVNFHKGWFSDTLQHYKPEKGIAVLRLDGDWYDSTMDILDNLFKYVNPGGIIVIDDYLIWDGCSRAVHDYLSKNSLAERISISKNKLVYIIKK